MDLEDILNPQQFKIALNLHLKKMRKSGRSDEEINLFEEESKKLFSSYKLAHMHGGQDFRQDQIDASIFSELNPLQQGFVHYLSGNIVKLENGTKLPFAATIHEGGSASRFIIKYLSDNNPEYLMEIITTNLDKASKYLRRLENEPSFLKEIVDDHLNVEDMALSMMCAEERKDFVRSSPEDIENKILSRAAESVERLKEIKARPDLSCEDAYMFIRFIELGHRGYRNNEVIYLDNNSDLGIMLGLNFKSKVKYIFAISDKYRLLEEQKLETIAYNR